MEALWNYSDDIKVVYSDIEVDVNGLKARKARVVKTGDKSALKRAITDLSRGGHSTEVEDVTNDGFYVQITVDESSGYRASLDYWYCVFWRDDVEPFMVSVTSKYLLSYVLNTTLIDGKSTEPNALFATIDGFLGLIAKNSALHNEMLEDLKTRKSFNVGKTTKWRAGYCYDTLTLSDVMLGYFSNVLTVDTNRHWPHNSGINIESTLKFDFKSKEVPVYQSVNDKSTLNEALSDWNIDYTFFNSYKKPETKCPSRKEGRQMFADEEAVNKQIVDKLIHRIKTKGYLEFSSVIRGAFMFYNKKDYTKQILTAYRSQLATLTKDSSSYNEYTISNSTSNDVTLNIVVQDGHIIETFTDVMDLLDYIIDEYC